ncbi:MAG: AraC family transcriptional regulator [Cyclobacteriaceae bacterium]|nr:AraC family transcriptional regulator [Cyclobacteriaceae bacterium]
MSNPRFVDIDGKVYNADSCLPLNEAWQNGDIELRTLARGTYPGTQLGPKELTGIKSIGYWDARKAQPWGLDWHRNEGIEICYLESGALRFHINQQEYQLQPRDITITRPWLVHRLGSPHVGACKLHWIIMDVGVRHPHQEWKWPTWIILGKEDLDDLTKFLRHNESPVWKAGNEMSTIFEQIGQTVTKGNYYDSKLKIAVNSLLMTLLDLFRSGHVELNEALIESKRTVELFLKELENHLQEAWTLESIAHHCHLGTTQVTKYCKEISNMSPMQYLSFLRIKKSASLLLENPVLRIADVAYETGFSSPQYFATVFRQQYKKTPGQFRIETSVSGKVPATGAN